MSRIIPTYVRWPITLVRGQGSTVVDSEGREYLDLIAGLAVASLGHAHPRVTDAVAQQAAKLTHVSNLYRTEPQELLAERLAGLTDGYLSFFGNSGAEAIECALKLARRWGGPDRPRLLAAHNSFHGRTTGALAVTGQPSKKEPFLPLLPGVEHVPYDDIQALEETLRSDVAAVLLEPIQGEAGVIVPATDYLRRVKALCDAVGALLIVDEVQTGVGRTGTWFASEGSGIAPDVICLAKGLAGGLPIGVCLASPRVADAFQAGDHASTFGGGPVQCAAALAVLDVIEEEGLLAHAATMGDRLMEGLRSIFGAAEVRGRGLLVGVDLGREAARELTEVVLNNGVLINNATPSVLRLAPPLIITPEEIDEGLSVIERSWKELG